MSKDLRIVPVTKAELRKAVEKNTYWETSMVPIPKSKAIWLLSNTRIEEEDYCGVFGFEGDKMVAFIYMFPDLFNFGKQIEKGYWELLWWVDHAYKDTVLGTYIFNEALNLANKKVIVKSYAESVNDFYEKQAFKLIQSRLRHTIFFSLDTNILLGRFSFLKYFKLILKGADKLVGALVNKLNKLKAKKRTATLEYHYLNKLDQATWEFIKPLCQNDLVHKTKEYIDWQLDNSQYTQIPVVNKFKQHSLQVGIGHNIRIHKVKIVQDETIIGFISYVINHKEFNIKYFLVSDQSNYDKCVDALIAHFTQSGMNFIFTDDTELSNNINKRFTTIFTYKIAKKALAHDSIEFGNEALKIYNRDGHFY
ncbi:hypothetical protein [Aquimarina agarilytica]|uniref:hypothetical protein n=1 Tax=Aquimarina agarilytica TaxID=1087449 RepID=UPI00028A03A9|nr:hypothetical protein [Aquimarina agarilytica]